LDSNVALGNHILMKSLRRGVAAQCGRSIQPKDELSDSLGDRMFVECALNGRPKSRIILQ
jgi:hypothetical protein